MNQIKAKVYKVGVTKEFQTKTGGEPFRKRELILDAARFDPCTGERSVDNYVVIEFSNKRCADLDNVGPGDLVTVDYILQGRKYNDKVTNEEKFITSVIGIGITVNKANEDKPLAVEVGVVSQTGVIKEESNDLPF